MIRYIFPIVTLLFSCGTAQLHFNQDDDSADKDDLSSGTMSTGEGIILKFFRLE